MYLHFVTQPISYFRLEVTKVPPVAGWSVVFPNLINLMILNKLGARLSLFNSIVSSIFQELSYML
jgi:hypothetical protein